MKKEQLKVGQTVFLKPTGNAGRRSSEIKIVTIESVGSKYFNLKGWKSRFKIEDGLQDNGQYITDYMAYLSMQEIEDERELAKGIENIKKNAHKLSLEQVRGVLGCFGIKADL